jgi:hypothetical protein
MTNILRIVVSSLMLGVILSTSGCVVAEPREGYYDRDHHRWYHEHGWHDCGPGDEHCR